MTIRLYFEARGLQAAGFLVYPFYHIELTLAVSIAAYRHSMRTLICGSIAYDTVMVFQGRFADHILPDQVHILNVSFLVPEMKREFGGCAGNIAYSLKMPRR